MVFPVSLATFPARYSSGMNMIVSSARDSTTAAAFPEVSFRLDHGKRNVLDASSVSGRRERLFQIEGSWLEGAVTVEESVGQLRLQGWLSAPADARGTSGEGHWYASLSDINDTENRKKTGVRITAAIPAMRI